LRVTTYTSDPIRLVDVDSHITEPPDLWSKHAPERLKDRLPQVVERGDKSPHWVIDGQDFGPIAYTAVAPDGSRIHGESEHFPGHFHDIHPGSYDLVARLEWLDQRGIDQQVIFPNIGGFSGVRFLTDIHDGELRTACVTVYNDAMAELQRSSNNRLFPLAMVPWWEEDGGVTEIRRARTDLGLRGITMCDSPDLYGFPTLNKPEWEGFWATCEELDLAVAFHIGSGNFKDLTWIERDRGEHLAAQIPNSFLNNSWVIANLLFSGVLHRRPGLKIFSAETGIGWLPFFMEALDYQWHENLLPEVRRDVWKHALPSEVFRRNFYVSFWFEQFGPAHAIDIVGEDNVMFETDFPHGTALTPRVTEQVAKTLTALDPDVRRKVLRDNAARLFDLP
jgi:predicted TIM-barrel fold metal-dependent hydrolase